MATQKFARIENAASRPERREKKEIILSDSEFLAFRNSARIALCSGTRIAKYNKISSFFLGSKNAVFPPSLPISLCPTESTFYNRLYKIRGESKYSCRVIPYRKIDTLFGRYMIYTSRDKIDFLFYFCSSSIYPYLEKGMKFFLFLLS